jgi:hypothetical protein
LFNFRFTPLRDRWSRFFWYVSPDTFPFAEDRHEMDGTF